jgi:hypothetical protein
MLCESLLKAFRSLRFCACVIPLATLPLLAQSNASKSPPKAMQTQASSTLAYSTESDGALTVEIRNVTFEVTSSGISGRPREERLMLRKTVQSKEVAGDIGVEATVRLEAWPLGADVRQKPLYTISETGTAGNTVDADLFVVDRRLEEVAWWSVHKLGNGQRLFDTYVPLVSFSLSREIVNTRYAGLDVPPDDAKDKRLNEPHVVAVISFASADKVIREALLTADDPKQAQLLRSYADCTRTLSDMETLPDAKSKDAKPRHTLKLSISQDYPSLAASIDVLVPIAGDDLDVANAKLPPHLHLVAWKR